MRSVPPMTGFPALDDVDGEDGDDDELHAARPAAASTAAASPAKRFDALVIGEFLRPEVKQDQDSHPTARRIDPPASNRPTASISAVNPFLRCPRGSVPSLTAPIHEVHRSSAGSLPAVAC